MTKLLAIAVLVHFLAEFSNQLCHEQRWQSHGLKKELMSHSRKSLEMQGEYAGMQTAEPDLPEGAFAWKFLELK